MYDEHDTVHLINPQDLDYLFSSLPRLSPFIRRLSFPLGAMGRVVNPPISVDMLRKLRDLVTLRTDVEIPTTVLNQLANLPSLKSFHTPTISRLNMRNFTTSRNQFLNLKYFSFFTDTPNSSIITMLDSMQCQFLELSCLFKEGCRSLAEIRSLVASLHRHPSKTSLKRLRLGFRNPPGLLATPLLAFENFRPLCLFSALTGLEIEPVALDDYWLKEIARTWPNLERLTVPACAAERPKVTLEGIISLIKFCPRLSELRITIKACPVPPTILDGIHNHHIKTIALDHSTVVQPKKVFRSLIRIFPRLTAITFREVRHLYTVEESLAYKNGWNEINSLLGETH